MEFTQVDQVDWLISQLIIHKRKRFYALIGLLLLLGAVVGVASSIGSVDVPLSTVWRLLLSQLPGMDLSVNTSNPINTIVLDIRLPRIILAGLVGAALSVAGAVYQGLFRNPLADPYLIGVAQGAGLGATIGFLLPFSSSARGLSLIPMLAFAGSLLSVGVVYALARVGKTLPTTTLILAGVALGAFLSSITSYLLVVSGEQLHGILLWLMGGFSLSCWGETQILFPYVVIGTGIICLYSKSLNLMQLDEEQAQQLGVNVELVKRVLLGAATLITAAAVSFAGIIGFVGIIIPHTVRLLWGPDYRFLVPLSGLAGAVFLILADTLARTMLGPAEVPVGVVTAFCGAPFFLYLLRRRRRVTF